jgi:uncharacterized protein (DUF2342 family)
VRLARLAAANAVQATPSEATTYAALAGAHTPASTNAQAVNATKDPAATTPTKSWSPGRVRIYHARKATRRTPPEGGHQELEPCLKSYTISVLVEY